MRLVDVETLRLEEFVDGCEIPSYAILSHTWGDQEVSYQQFTHPTSHLRSTKGYKKIKACCSETRQWGLRYVWIDTCCIDKTSSAELSEAINSMFRWYADATICIAYLSDVDSWRRDDKDVERQIRRSRYFTRGWTLQELIAPQKIEFYDGFWIRIGTKEEMSRLLDEITGVSYEVLLHKYPLSRCSVACRMSWAASRRTTRVEDVAYCLLGIFKINMPLLYGEGRNAFRRLQEEIIKESDDQTIFAWENTKIGAALGRGQGAILGVLAEHPAQFKSSADFRRAPYRKGAYSITNKGLSIELPLLHTRDSLLAVLACYGQPTSATEPGQLLIAIPVSQVIGVDKDATSTSGENIFCRNPTLTLQLVDEEESRNATFTSMYIYKSFPEGMRVSKRLEDVL